MKVALIWDLTPSGLVEVYRRSCITLSESIYLSKYNVHSRTVHEDAEGE